MTSTPTCLITPERSATREVLARINRYEWLAIVWFGLIVPALTPPTVLIAWSSYPPHHTRPSWLLAGAASYAGVAFVGAGTLAVLALLAGAMREWLRAVRKRPLPAEAQRFAQLNELIRLERELSVCAHSQTYVSTRYGEVQLCDCVLCAEVKELKDHGCR